MRHAKGFWRAVFFILLITALCGGMALPLMQDRARAAPQLQAASDVVIGEFRPVGPMGRYDEFVELYNRSNAPVSIANWVLKRSSGCGSIVSVIGSISAGVTLAPGQHYLIGGNTYSGSVPPDQANVPLNIASDGGIALFQADATTLVDQVGLCATTLFHEGTALVPLTSRNDRSYDRQRSASGICVDTNNNAADFFSRSPSDPHNRLTPLTACGNATRTPRPGTQIPTRTPSRTPTPRPPPALVAISEFVPRPGHDWNNDGMVNVGDEFVELINHGVIDVSLSGYALDDEVNLGSNPFRLPAVTLKPGERRAFYGSETGLLLSDGGDGVRLIQPNGQLGDAYNYRLARFPDQSYCRLPDNGGLDAWNQNCYPTPGLQNSLGGAVSPPVTGEAVNLCLIADRPPEGFVFAECPPFANVWNRDYWDREGWFGEKFLPNSPGKWNVFVD